ncbi:MAG: hypothetical protein FWG85_03710, partial [Bacteroidetes bacterium]|nr:hypothetical protein [Bacteroidota bacterium]
EITNSFEILYSKNSCCSNLPAVIPSDTIYYKDENGIEKCLNLEDSNRIYFPLEMTDLDSAIWIIGEDTLQTETEKDSLGYYFPLPDLSEYEDEYLIITVILPDGTEVHFKFRVYDHENVVSNAIPLWQDLLNFDYEIEGNTAIINVDLRNGFTVPLPNIDGCSLSVDVDSSVVWSYDIDSNIVFEPTEECDISGRLVYECECIGVLNINIHNTGCDTIPCNDCVEFLDIENCTQYMTGYSSSKIEKCIQISTKLECADSTGEYKKILKVESVDSLTGNTETIENVARNDYLLVLQSPCVGKDTNVAFYINVTLDDNSICSDTFRFSYKCYSLIDNYYILNMGIWEGWDEVMCIYYGIDRSALGLQLKITIVDVNGAEVLLVYDDVPQTLRGCIDVNISGLPSGQYHLVYQIGDEVFTISFSKP